MAEDKGMARKGKRKQTWTEQQQAEQKRRREVMRRRRRLEKERSRDCEEEGEE